MADVFDFKKQYKDMYMPAQDPMLIDVPRMRFFCVEGYGDPNEEGGAYKSALEVLYGLCYTVKMSKMGGNAPKGYFDYIIPPLEGLWWLENEVFDPVRLADKSQYRWMSMIRQPDFVDQTVLQWAKSVLKEKKPSVDTSKATFVEWTEGLCVQCMHIGPYENEPATLAKMKNYIQARGYADAIGDPLPDGLVRRHHEVYLGDPRKSAPDKMKTVLRHPVRSL